MYNNLKFKFNIQLFAEDGQGEKTNDLLSYELLKKEHDELKEYVKNLENGYNKQLEDIKNVIRSGNRYNGQEKQDNYNEKDKKELEEELFAELKKRL